MSKANRPPSPFVGLVPFSEREAPYFFGRDAETEIIIANLMASRLTVLYGESGVGKSSVLGASVVPRLHELAQTNLKEYGSPEFAVVQFGQWVQDPIAALARGVGAEIGRTVSGGGPAEVATGGSLVEMLAGGCEKVGGDLLIILDQFEEYFLYHAAKDGPGTFAHEFPLAVNRPDLRVSFLVAIREDALAKLDRFKGRIPNLFDNYLRIKHLSREAAGDAIHKPIERYNRDSADGDKSISIEPDLAKAVLDQVQTGETQLGRTGRGSLGPAAGGESDGRVEAPYLQLVMLRLWEEEAKAKSRVLRVQTLEKLGGADKIVRTHLDRTMGTLTAREQKIAAGIYDRLVTPSGSKIALTAGDLAAYARRPEPKVGPVLDRLSDPAIRILRPVAPPPDQAIRIPRPVAPPPDQVARPVLKRLADQAIRILRLLAPLPGQAIRILRPVAPPRDHADAPRYEIFHDVLAAAVLDWQSRYRATKLKKRLKLAATLLVVLTCCFAAVLWHLNGQSQAAALVPQLFDRSPDEFKELVWQKLAPYRWWATEDLTSIVKQQPYSGISEVERIRLGKRRADAAIALFALGEGAKALDVLRVKEDPESLTQFVHRAKDRGIGPTRLFEQLSLLEKVAEYDALNRATQASSVRYGLILTLGEFKADEIPEARRKIWVDKLAQWYRNDRSSAVHGACGWLLRQWGEGDRVKEVDETSIPYDEDRQWFVQEFQYPDGEAGYMTFVVFEPGKFQMGSRDNERDRVDEEFQHAVRLTKPFYLGMYEVTQADYERVMGTNPSDHSETGPSSEEVAGLDTRRFPVETVPWDDAVKFCQKLSDLPRERAAGRTYRLPAEAEWEYACRAGTQTRFSCGTDEDWLRKYASFYGDAIRRTEVCGQRRPNPRGLFDIHGNVSEWCHDWYQKEYYRESPKDDPKGPAQTDRRVNRGGDFISDVLACRSAFRSGGIPDERFDTRGFRVVAVPSSKPNKSQVK